MKTSTFLVASVLTIAIGIDAFAAPSVRMGTTTNTPAQTIARAGTLRSGSARAGKLTNQTVKTSTTPTSVASYTVASDSDTASNERLSFLKSITIPSNNNNDYSESMTSNDVLESRINELQDAIGELQTALEVERNAAARKDEVYVKSEINQFIPTTNTNGNVGWKDTNGSYLDTPGYYLVHSFNYGGNELPLITDKYKYTGNPSPAQLQEWVNIICQQSTTPQPGFVYSACCLADQTQGYFYIQRVGTVGFTIPRIKKYNNKLVMSQGMVGFASTTPQQVARDAVCGGVSETECWLERIEQGTISACGLTSYTATFDWLISDTE